MLISYCQSCLIYGLETVAEFQRSMTTLILIIPDGLLPRLGIAWDSGDGARQDIVEMK
jgi:hypothetical protein